MLSKLEGELNKAKIARSEENLARLFSEDESRAFRQITSNV
jgi:hypothetical protein